MLHRRQILTSFAALTAAAMLPRVAVANTSEKGLDVLAERAHLRVNIARKLADLCPRVRDYGRSLLVAPTADEARIEHTAYAMMSIPDASAERLDAVLDGKAPMSERCAHCEEKATQLVIVGTLQDLDVHRYGNPLRCPKHVTTKLEELGTLTDVGDGTSFWSYDHATSYFLVGVRGAVVAGVGPRILKRWKNEA